MRSWGEKRLRRYSGGCEELCNNGELGEEGWDCVLPSMSFNYSLLTPQPLATSNIACSARLLTIFRQSSNTPSRMPRGNSISFQILGWESLEVETITRWCWQCISLSHHWIQLVVYSVSPRPYWVNKFPNQLHGSVPNSSTLFIPKFVTYYI